MQTKLLVFADLMLCIAFAMSEQRWAVVEL